MTKPFQIPKALVWEAFKRVKANGGAAGVDAESIEMFESKLSDNRQRRAHSEEVRWSADAGCANGCR